MTDWARVVAIPRELSEALKQLERTVMRLRAASPWLDYASTIVGWSSYTVREVYYKRDGQTVYVAWNISGTSDSTSITFTLPFPVKSTPASWAGACGLAIDNGSVLTGSSRWVISGSTVTIYKDMGTGAWTNSGTKSTRGSFWYEAKED